MLGKGLLAAGGQSGAHTSGPPQPNQPQNQPSRAALVSRTMMAAPLVGFRLMGSMPAHAAAGVGNISFTIMAPSGSGSGLATVSPPSGRLRRSHSSMSREYQTHTGLCVP